MSSETSFAEAAPKRGGTAVLIAVGVVVSVLLVATAGVVVANAADGSPALSLTDEHPAAAGGIVEVTGTATNTGDGDAQNVGVQLTVAVGAGLMGSAPNIAQLAHGASTPFTTTIDTNGGSVPNNVLTTWKTHWDTPDFESTDESGSFRYGGHTNGTRSGTLRNMGKADAQNVLMTITFAADEGFKTVITTGSEAWPLVAAGASVPYSITGDLGASAPQTIYWDWKAAWSEPKVSVTDIKTRWLGGTVTLAGMVRNRGSAAAGNVVVTRTLVDASGNTLGTVSTELGRLAPGTKAPYSLNFPLGNRSFNDIERFRVKLGWTEVHFLFLTTSGSLQDSG